MTAGGLKPGQRVTHADHGDGVVVDSERNGYVRAFFAGGERVVAIGALQPLLSRTERILASVESFTMVDEERTFYAALKEYLEDGFALAQRQGNQVVRSASS